MSSTYSRGQIVADALSLAGRASELKQTANQWLNYALIDIGLTFRFPELRKVGSTGTLSIGTSTATLPADLGAGMEKGGMIFGPDRKPLYESSFEELILANAFPPANSGGGKPLTYAVDKQAGVFRFNANADVAYSFTPIYFMSPPLLKVDTSDDTKSVWLDNDAIAVHALVWWIYVFTEDTREDKQEARVISMLNKWKAETTKMGGTSRILPSPARFKKVSFGGMNGP